MRRSTLVFLAVGWVALVVLVLIADLSPARSASPTTWRLVPASEFSPLAVPRPPETTPAPLVVSLPAQPVPTPQRPSPIRAYRLSGVATWWDSWGHGLYAAAGPRLRAAMGPGYLHRWVTACSRGQCVRVRLTTSCACQPPSRLIDLSLDAFSRLADPGLGILQIEVSW